MMGSRGYVHRIVVRRFVLALAGLGAFAAYGAGCGATAIAQRERLAHAACPAPLPEAAWPERSLDRAARALEDLGPEPRVLTVPTPVRFTVDTVDRTAIAVLPVLRLFEPALHGQGLVFRLERLGAASEEDRADLPPSDPGLSMKFVSFAARRGDRPSPARSEAGPAGGDGGAGPPPSRRYRRLDPWTLAQRGIWMRMYLPPAPVGGDTALPYRGLVVHLSSFGGAKFEQPVIDQFVAAGWAVLRVASPSLRPVRGAPDVSIETDEEFDPAARTLAKHVDDRLAEHAYAVEAALAYLAERLPEVPSQPAVLMGFSAGALVAPAVAARLPERFDAAVLVCGGANLLDIAQRSELTDGGVKVRWGRGRGTPADVQRLNGLYLAYSRLDPYHTAAYLGTTPVLHVHGIADGIVPADCGDLLYERLNRPERIEFPLGHKGVFFLLPSQGGRLLAWVNRTVAASPHGGRLASRGTGGAAPEPPRSAVP
jgi:predicted esterase